MEITKEHVDAVCLFGQGERTCAFLAMGGGFRCMKDSSIEPVIRERLASGAMNAKGDNCDGWALVMP